MDFPGLVSLPMVKLVFWVVLEEFWTLLSWLDMLRLFVKEILLNHCKLRYYDFSWVKPVWPN